MTRKEQIIEILNNHKIIDAKRDNILVLYAKDVEIGFIADEILALPLDVPGDEDVLNYAVDHNRTQKYTTIDYYATGRAEGAKWMRSEILKRNGR